MASVCPDGTDSGVVGGVVDSVMFRVRSAAAARPCPGSVLAEGRRGPCRAQPVTGLPCNSLRGILLITDDDSTAITKRKNGEMAIALRSLSSDTVVGQETFRGPH